MMAIQNIGDVLWGLNVLIINFDDEVSAYVNRNIAQVGTLTPAAQAGAIGRATGYDLLNQDSRIGRET